MSDSLPYVSGADVAAALDHGAAADAVERALQHGLDPDAAPPRTKVAAGAGELLVMPAVVGPYATVKLVSVGGDPQVQGVCIAFDTATLAPVAAVDGVALTTLRTAAVSLVALRRLARRPERAVVFGRGPQGRAHAAAIEAHLGVERVDVVGREDADRALRLVAAADVVCCCTTAATPLFDGSIVGEGAAVVAIGSHSPEARETDDALAARATVVVESRATALREAGDVIAAVESGALAREDLVPLADVVRGDVELAPGRPRLFKGTGMAWQDAVVVGALLTRLGVARQSGPAGSANPRA
jgi:ornithine cyclodeaminase/alanine dehydrogenase-like protein (mu-crystallin family)